MNLKTILNDVIEDRLQRVGEALVQAQEEALSDPGSSDVHSRPGEAPRRQSGRLANSFSFTVVNGELRVTSDCPYWKYLQEGTGRIAPRDVLAGYNEQRQHIINIIVGRE